MLWRHGDVLVAQAIELPKDAKLQSHLILAKGEVTGHAHRIAEPHAAQLWEFAGALFLKVIAEKATLVHEEHNPIVLPQGTYRVWMQREYSPAEIRRVVD
jgi:hypothetical protein